MSIAAETETALPFWLVNVPKSEWPEKCPGFLINASDRDRAILSTPDSQYYRPSWAEVREYVSKMILTPPKVPSVDLSQRPTVSTLSDDYHQTCGDILPMSRSSKKTMGPFSTS